MTSYERATRDYDNEHERQLTEQILHAVIAASRVDDADAIIIRTSEIIEALLKTLALTLALSPHAKSPTKLRTASDTIAKRLRILTEHALHDPDFQQSHKGFFDGNDVGGTA
jgi:hypothetical protein